MRISTLKPRLATLSNRLQSTVKAGATIRIRGSKWQAMRLNHLRDNPLCAHCLANNHYSAANEVDHITPLWNGGLEFNPNNLQSLCTPCHKAKTAAEASLRAKQFNY